MVTFFSDTPVSVVMLNVNVTGVFSGTVPGDGVTVTRGAAFAAIVTSFDSVAPTIARTRVSRLVVSAVRASPFASVSTRIDDGVPAVVVKFTAPLGTGLWPSSTTKALSVTEPPRVAETDDGFAVRMILLTAAAPMMISSGPDVAPPENARTTAVP